MTQAHLDLAVGGITSTHSSRVTAVDGLRAIAVAGVIAFHYQLGLGGGFLGVDLFFVISGYVITRALIHEQRTDAPSMGAMFSGFWKRRFRRIFPALATVLAAVTLWSWVLPNSDSFRRAVGTGTLAALVSGSNWWEIYGPSGYWSLEGDRNPLAHLWSLGVEEQFYLFFPLVFLLATPLLNPTLRWKAAVVAAGVAYAWAAWLGVERITEVGVDRIYLGTDTRCGALLLGCALAWYLEQHRHRAGQTLRAQTAPRWSTGILRILSVIALGTLAALWSIAQVNNQWFFVIMLPLAGVAATILIGLLVTAPQSILARALGAAARVGDN